MAPKNLLFVAVGVNNISSMWGSKGEENLKFQFYFNVPLLAVNGVRPWTPVNFFIFDATAARWSFCSVATVAALYSGGGRYFGSSVLLDDMLNWIVKPREWENKL